MIVERHTSTDGLVTLVVDLTGDGWTVGFEPYGWHAHGDIRSARGCAGSPAEATRSFVADVLASGRPIVVSRVDGVVRDAWVQAANEPAGSADGLVKYGVPGETDVARHWDGRPFGS